MADPESFLTLAPGGWAEYVIPGDAGVVYVRFAKGADGRFGPVELFVEGAAEIPGALLRRFPLARITAVVNGPLVRGDEEMAALFEQPGPEVRGPLSRHFLESDSRAVGVHAHGPKLRIPKARNKGNAFYHLVASVYSDLAAQGAAPARRIAEANGVPVTTVHRWVKEARRRGLLPPGRVGTAG